ncbi:MAG: riboflavin biosynthesis protein RibF [Myxococcales bacterium]|nr:riboflavin biosynthesis protein RibF [Myxococcales bacterium]
MQVLRQPVPLPPGTAACIGAFDGLHRGHQALLARARTAASGVPAGRVALVTFDPHPARVLAPERAPPLLQSQDQRARVCAALGVDVLVLLPFDRTLAATSPSEFARDLLVDGLRPAHVVVGPDFRFGAGRGGGVSDLAELLRPASIPVTVVDLVEQPARPEHADAHDKLSSSNIRAAVAAGAVAEAAHMLGRWYAVEGEVVHGARRGRELGVRTANVDAPRALLPRPGIYAGALAVHDGEARGGLWPAAISLGHNPTFGPDAPLSLEVHALGAELGERLYGCTVEVAFAARLRDEQRFNDAEELTAQIARDIAAVRPQVDPGLALNRPFLTAT